jgi:hypothetical protein
MKRRILTVILILTVIFPSFRTAAQESRKTQVALSTDLVDWANFGTVNLEAGVSLHQHFSVHAGAKYNPWNFKTHNLGLALYNKQTTAYAGFRYWPWYVLSGWWVGAQAQYTDYAETGVWRHALDTGKAIGGGVSFGYTLMLHENLNLEFGAGVWAGRRFEHTLYCCPDCMKVRESGPGNFVALNDISISLMYVF